MISALIPVKPFSRAKSRLGSALSPEQRIALAEALFARTLQIVSEVPSINSVILVCAADVSPPPMPLPVLSLPDPGRGLNAAIAAGLAQCDADAAVILPTDLPLLHPTAIQRVAVALESIPGPAMVIAPDRFEEGTNVLALRPPTVLRTAYGRHSFRNHCAAALRAGLTVSVLRDPALAFDLDTPGELALLPADQWGWLQPHREVMPTPLPNRL